jgi:crossover junction endodeoxyribonuclease RuvC
MKVIGIDVGTAITGWGVIGRDEKNKSKYKIYDYGAIRTSSKTPMYLRLLKLSEDLTEVVKKHKPDHMGVEDLFYFKNKKTVISVGQARGVIMLTGAKLGLQVFDYTPLQVKQAVTGYGRASKKQMQKMVKSILGLKEIPKPDDVADGIAVAVCHLNSYREGM